MAVVTRRSGGVGAVHQLANYLMMSRAVIAPSPYWMLAHGDSEGEVGQDEEGLQILREHSRNMAWLIRMIDSTRDNADRVQPERKIRTSFIR